MAKENAVSNLELVRRLSNNIVLAFDADRAGFNASNRAAKIALSLGMDVKVVSMPEGIDPADLISKSGSSAWRQVIKDSKHIIEFLLDKALKSVEDERKIGREIKEKILPYVDALESSIEKTYFLKKISDMSSIPVSALKDDLEKIKKDLAYERKETEETKETEDKLFRKDYIERRLLGIVLWQGSLADGKKPGIDVSKIMAEMADVLNIEEDKLLDKFKEEKEDLIFEAEVFYDGKVDLEKDAKELLDNFREEHFREELGRKMKELRMAEEKKDYEKSSLILQECQIINNKIQDIKNGRFKKYS